MAKIKMGTLIHVRATALHSKGNKSYLARLHGPKYKDKKINGKVVGVEFLKSDKGINNCHIIRHFNEVGNVVLKSIPVGQVTLGHVDINPRSDPLYHPSAVADAAAAAAAATFIPPLPAGLSDTPLETQEMPPPTSPPPPPPPAGASPAAASMVAAASPAAANITGASFATGGGRYFASPTNNIDVLSESPAPFQLPAGYIAGIPERCVSTKTTDHGEPFFTAKNGQLWYKPKNNMPIYIDDGRQ